MAVSHLFFKELPHFILADFAQETRFDAELGQAAHGVGCRASRGALATKFFRHALPDFDGIFRVHVCHASLRQVQFLKDLFIGNLGQNVDQGTPYSEDSFH